MSEDGNGHSRRAADRRVERLEERVNAADAQRAALQARVDDHEGDIRSFGTMVLEHEKIRSAIDRIVDGQQRTNEELTRLEKRLEEEREQHARQRKLREDREEAVRIQANRDAADAKRDKRKEFWRNVVVLAVGIIAATATVVAAIVATAPH